MDESSERRVLQFGIAGALTLVLSLVLPTIATAGSGKLTQETYSLPSASSGQSYSFQLKATGGTEPYHCVAMALENVGNITLNKDCVISGTAPKVDFERITGPFTFTMTDSSTPAQTIKFTGLDFTTKTDNYTPQSFDGAYAIRTIITFTVTGAAGAANVPTQTENTVANVVNGQFRGKLIGDISALGSGHVSNVINADGVTFTESWTFSHSFTGDGVSVMGLGTAHGDENGVSVTVNFSSLGHRTAVTP